MPTEAALKVTFPSGHCVVLDVPDVTMTLGAVLEKYWGTLIRDAAQLGIAEDATPGAAGLRIDGRDLPPTGTFQDLEAREADFEGRRVRMAEVALVLPREEPRVQIPGGYCSPPPPPPPAPPPSPRRKG